jgi:hypothetical protein
MKVLRRTSRSAPGTSASPPDSSTVSSPWSEAWAIPSARSFARNAIQGPSTACGKLNFRGLAADEEESVWAAEGDEVRDLGEVAEEGWEDEGGVSRRVRGTRTSTSADSRSIWDA